MTGIETRSFEVRSVQEDRTVEGIAVPYGETIDLGGIYERFEPGAFGEPTDVKLFSEHRDLIGVVEKTEDTDKGFVIKARISKTPKGDEVYTLLRDGALNKFSVGFIPVETREEDNVFVRTKAELKEVSVVAFPAYTNADVALVRNADTTSIKETHMSNDTNAPEVAELRDAVTDLERRMATISEAKPANATLDIRSAGEFIKGLRDGSTKEKVEHYNRAFSGMTTTDGNVQPAWVASNIRLANENRDTLNLFSKEALPASGNSVEYLTLSAATGTVAVQAAEGDDLGYLEVVLDDATAPVKTYGGYTSLSRQAIERSGTPLLSTAFEHMVRQYAKATNAAVRAALVAGSGYQTATLAADTGAGWVGLVVDGAGLIHDNGFGSEAEFILVSKDVFKRVAVMADSSGRPLLEVNGDGSNTIGSAGRARKGSIFGLPLVVDPGLAANSCYIASSDALKVWESAGAPFRLDDENIINLSKDFSLYGYMAVGITNVKSVVKVDVDLV
ncbi:HK97 family phage prohead protease [Streptomyces turgidiscabies]|uniref:HK97 family phage prohead protease n=1 Tax=Streptomyces TaxID=1883 RepID=UPI00076EFCD0|nr:MULTISPECIES: HK97 family phage prohead protease [Streptomyces]MDX3498596.1 HK97 family phage prohead protease [Streptomyces turgidiscabies]GAQ73605.1 caudovirus prohead protease [Streptomyces turgidiscabies]